MSLTMRLTQKLLEEIRLEFKKESISFEGSVKTKAYLESQRDKFEDKGYIEDNS